MKPANLKSKIFIDGGNPKETEEIKNLLGFLDGQTTNPTLVSKNPEAAKKLEKGEKFLKEELLEFYKEIVQKVSSLIPDGSISIEVYADKETKAEEMLNQGKEMFTWIPNAHIKFPTIKEGLKAANLAVKEGMRVNMTLVFTQEQAAAVYGATRGARKGQVFLSPFIGRLDDRGENGMSLVENIIKMYSKGDGHVEVLTASLRNINHLLYALHLGSDIITSPAKILREWFDSGLGLPGDEFVYIEEGLKDIPYKKLSLDKNWEEYEFSHSLIDAGVEKFASDWNSLLKS